MSWLTSRVYFMQAESGGPIKIGYSTHVLRRFHELRTLSNIPLKIIASVWAGREVETALHRCFADIRLHGEWFEPTEALFKSIHALQEMEKDGPIVVLDELLEDCRPSPYFKPEFSLTLPELVKIVLRNKEEKIIGHYIRLAFLMYGDEANRWFLDYERHLL